MATSRYGSSRLLLLFSVLLYTISRFRSVAFFWATTARISTTRGAPSFRQHRSFGLLAQHSFHCRSSDSSNNMSSSTSTVPPTTTPPVPPREEDRVVFVGAAPPGWKAELPRQSESSTEELIDPPNALPDPYGWMRNEDRKDEKVLQHLHAENAYTQGVTAHLEDLRTKLYEEMVAAIQETDYTTPHPDGKYFLYTRTMAGKSYTIHCRAPKPAEGGMPTINWDGTAEAPILPGEEVTLDVNVLAEGKSYCSTGAVTYSPSQKLLAYSADYTGGETCLLYVKDLATGKIVDHDEKLEISGSVKWGADDSTLFYIKMDATHRPYQVYRRRLQSGEPDEMLLEEPDDLYWMGIYKSLDGKYLFVESSSKETSEIHFLDLHDPDATLQCIATRRPKVLYEVEHREGQWWISSNVDKRPNLALFTAPAEAECADQWALVQGPDGNTLFDGSYERSLDHVSCFRIHVVASGREGGLPRVWLLAVNEQEKVTNFEMLQFDEEAYDVGLGTNREYETDTVVVAYDSLVTPTQSLEIHLDRPSERKVLKERAVPGYDKTLYGCERTTVLSRDGKTEIPVSLVYRRDVMAEHQSSGKPVHVHLYGACRGRKSIKSR